MTKTNILTSRPQKQSINSINHKSKKKSSLPNKSKRNLLKYNHQPINNTLHPQPQISK